MQENLTKGGKYHRDRWKINQEEIDNQWNKKTHLEQTLQQAARAVGHKHTRALRARIYPSNLCFFAVTSVTQRLDFTNSLERVSTRKSAKIQK